jgi:hypothetical protein
MDLAGKYSKSNLLGDGEVQVWRGRERARGTPVLLHTFASSPRLLRLAVEYLLMRPAGSPLIEIGEWEGATCLVTVSELELLDIGAWLQSAIASGPIAAPAPPPPVDPGVAAIGAAPIPRADSTAVPKPAPVPVAAPVAAPAPPPGPGAGPGEFTRAFQIPAPNAPPQHLPDPMASAGPAKPSPGPGEFTRLFHLPGQTGSREISQTPLSPPPLTATPTPSAGEFTRLFRAQPPDSSTRDFSGSGAAQQTLPTFPPPALPPEPAAAKLNIASGPVGLPERSAPPVPKGPGEYTRIIQTQPMPTAPPQAPPPPSPAAAQAVQLPAGMVPAMPSAPSMPSAPAPPTFHASVATPVAPSIPVPQAPSVQIPAPSAPRSGISPVVLLLGGLILVAVILVLIFALRK